MQDAEQDRQDVLKCFLPQRAGARAEVWRALPRTSYAGAGREATRRSMFERSESQDGALGLG